MCAGAIFCLQKSPAPSKSFNILSHLALTPILVSSFKARRLFFTSSFMACKAKCQDCFCAQIFQEKCEQVGMFVFVLCMGCCVHSYSCKFSHKLLPAEEPCMVLKIYQCHALQEAKPCKARHREHEPKGAM